MSGECKGLKDRSLSRLGVKVQLTADESKVHIVSNRQLVYDGGRAQLLEAINAVQTGREDEVPARLLHFLKNENVRRFIYATAYLEELIKS